MQLIEPLTVDFSTLQFYIKYYWKQLFVVFQDFLMTVKSR